LIICESTTDECVNVFPLFFPHSFSPCRLDDKLDVINDNEVPMINYSPILLWFSRTNAEAFVVEITVHIYEHCDNTEGMG